MARLFVGAGAADEGTLTIEELGTSRVNVLYHPSQARVERYKKEQRETAPPAQRLLHIDGASDYVTMYPIVTLPNSRFMKPKYPWIESITLDGFGFGTPATIRDIQIILEELPAGFVKDYDYGLGLQKDYDHVVNTLRPVRQIRCLAVCREEETRILGPVYAINEWDFDAVRRGINRITKNAQSEGRIDKEILVYNALMHRLDGIAYPERKRPYKRDTVYRFVMSGDSPGALLSEKDKDAAVDLVANSARAIAKTKSNKLLGLRNDIELVTLQDLIEKFESKIKMDLKEPVWQKFLRDNTFVIGLAFAAPIVIVDEQVSVGGRSLSRGGEKFTDFLVKSEMTSNTALVEIKTPGTPLLGSEYRGGVFAPSAALVGSVNQILDQREKFERTFLNLKSNSPGIDVESYSIRCFLIIGKAPTEKRRQRDFELYRNNSRGVDIITFDELLQKLKNIHDLLAKAQQAQIP